MNKRQRMYASNLKARNYLLYNLECTDVWFKSHTRRKDRTFTPDGFYPSTDLFNLFDGVALNKGVILFQVKSDRWAEPKPLYEFSSRFSGVTVMVLNVKKKKNGRFEVVERIY